MSNLRAFCLGLFGVLVLGLALVPSLAAADKPAVVGDWKGALDAGMQGTLHVIVHITQAADGKLTGTMDSPDQNASGIPITTITYQDSKLHFESAPINGSYDGTMGKDNSEIKGDWSQGGGTLPLVLTREK